MKTWEVWCRVDTENGKRVSVEIVAARDEKAAKNKAQRKIGKSGEIIKISENR